MAVINTNNFDYSITMGGEDVLDQDTILAYIFIKESINKLPEVEIKLMSNHMSRYINNCDLDISITTSSNIKYVYQVGIYNCTIDKDSYAYYGYGCKVKDFQEIGSAYLGEDLETAINSLGIKTYVEGVDKISGGYWQINETKLNCLYRLIKGVKSNSAVVINYDTIKVIDYNVEADKDENQYISPTKVEYISYNEFFNTPENGVPYKLYSANNMYNASWRDKSYVGYDHQDFAVNLVSSIKNNFDNKILIKMEYDNIFIPYEVGSSMNVELPLFKIGPMKIISKSTRFAYNKITTILIVEAGELL